MSKENENERKYYIESYIKERKYFNSITGVPIQRNYDKDESEMYILDDEDIDNLYFRRLNENSELNDDEKKFMKKWGIFRKNNNPNLFYSIVDFIIEFINQNKEVITNVKERLLFLLHIDTLYQYKIINSKDLDNIIQYIKIF
jgi:hypothetical protein